MNMSRGQQILTLLTSKRDRDCIAASRYAAMVHYCYDLEDLECRVATLHACGHGSTLGAVIMDCRPHDFAGPRELVASAVPLVFRTSLTPASFRQVGLLARSKSSHWVSLTTAEQVDVAISDVLSAPEGRSGQLIILDRLTCDLPSSVSSIVQTAVLLTHRRTTVVRLAAACGLAVRTLEWRLSSAGMPAARRIIGWTTALHAVWQLDVLGWTRKRVARDAGFCTTELLDVCVQHHTGARPLQLCQQGGFDHLLGYVGDILYRSLRSSQPLNEAIHRKGEPDVVGRPPVNSLT